MPEDLIRVPAGLTTEGLLGRRYMARLIDSVAIIALMCLVVLVSAVLGSASGIFVLLFVPVVWVGYFTAFECSSWQATIGKRLMGLRVYDRRGARARPLQIAGRSVLRDAPFALGAVPGLQIISLLWLAAHVIVLHRSDVYQAIHDKAAGTWVAAPDAMTQLRIT